MSDMQSIMDLLDKEYKNNVLEISILESSNNQLKKENDELITINDELRSEIGSQNESIIEINDFKK